MIYVFMADGTEETEAIVPVDILRRGGCQVTVVGVTGKTVTTSHGISVNCDKSLEEADPEDIEAVVLPGGMPGTINLENSAKVHRFLDMAAEEGKLLCAICAAPSILGHSHLLEGKKAIAFPGFEKDLYGASVCTSEYVVRDGNVITARGAGVAAEFGLCILSALTSEENARKTAETMQCR